MLPRQDSARTTARVPSRRARPLQRHVVCHALAGRNGRGCPDSDFKVRLVSHGGAASLEWGPDLSRSSDIRAYRVMGKKVMESTEWTEVTDAGDWVAEGWRFFQVRGALPEQRARFPVRGGGRVRGRGGGPRRGRGRGVRGRRGARGWRRGRGGGRRGCGFAILCGRGG